MYERVVKYLEENGHITSWEAIQNLRCTRISHYIYLMRKAGYVVESQVVKHVNSYGEKTHYTKYILRGFEKDE